MLFEPVFKIGSGFSNILTRANFAFSGIYSAVGACKRSIIDRIYSSCRRTSYLALVAELAIKFTVFYSTGACSEGIVVVKYKG